MKLKNILALAIVLVFMTVAVVGCGGQAPAAEKTDASKTEEPKKEEPKKEEPKAADKKIKIGLSMDSLESAFWVANHKAMVEKAKELNVEMVEMMAEGDPNKQNQQIENLIAQGVSAIICAPKDGGAIVAAVKKCQEAKIPIIMNNRPVQGNVEPELTVLSDNYAMAKEIMQWFVDKAKKENKKYKALLLRQPWR